jgi:hypothetical protein
MVLPIIVENWIDDVLIELTTNEDPRILEIFN